MNDSSLAPHDADSRDADSSDAPTRADRWRRLGRQMRTDMLVQQRNQLYPISIGIALLCGGALAWLSPDRFIAATYPMALLLFVGGSTLLYVVAMILLERDDGVLSALSVSPLRPSEYLASKVATLTFLATLEGVLLVIAGLAIRGAWSAFPNAWALVGLISLSMMHVLVGVLVVVRYRRITEALLPMGGVAVLLQLPALQIVGAMESPLIHLIPSYAPTLMLRAGFAPLTLGQWVYGASYTLVSLAALAYLAVREFERHIVRKAG